VTSRTVDALIEEMRERFSVTSVVITHDMTSAFDIADRVGMLVRGKIVVEGPPETVLAADNEDVQKFVVASAVDPRRLEARGKRLTAAQVRAAWAARHTGGEGLPPDVTRDRHRILPVKHEH
jgi:ABC-type transporter Mla maintaining outer membrane lipid asymmetry ATPase subunit MlaF